ncbi:MAG: division/cell wall cluster transcriptional repressor MraZ [Clostridia bacterium]|nr:division/cell wall cluster transcriptional repressor MraZ [Clostridia bacterium]
MAYFTGYHELFVDEKGRVILPKKLKEQTGSDVVLTQGLDGCVYILTPEEWHILEGKIAQLPMSKGLQISHFFNTYKTDVTADKQGRVQIPIHLRRLAAIEGNVMLIGNGNRIEIWNPDRFNAMVQKMDTASIMATMDELEF